MAVEAPAEPTRHWRVTAGTRIALRRATDEEMSYMWDQLWKHSADLILDPTEEEQYRLRPPTYVICWADDPTKVLKSFWSPVGHWLLEYALKDVDVYVRRRGAVYVGLLMPLLWQDDGDQA
jgi:hypothetical protein